MSVEVTAIPENEELVNSRGRINTNFDNLKTAIDNAPAIATQEQATAGTDNTTVMTPKTTKQAIDFADIGVVFGDTYLHTGCVKANGATVNRADYPRLVALANTYNLWTSDTANNLGLFGVGDGSTTMVLPNWTDRIAQFASTGGGTLAAGLPNITGVINGLIGQDGIENNITGAYSYGGLFNFTNIPDRDWIAIGNDNGLAKSLIINMSATNSNAIYGASSTVQPPAIKVIPQMKY